MRDVLLDNFLRVSSVPRSSGNEGKIADFFVRVAESNNLYYFRDKNNNLVIKKKGNLDGVIALQAHLDMVTLKDQNSNHNFSDDGIDVLFDGDRVYAKDTTLGADQGVGLAIMLTIMENDTLIHPDIEFLFTTEEETTFNGIINFPYSEVKSKRIINLDYHSDDRVIVASDGDVYNEYLYHGTIINNNLPSYKIELINYPSGNSGVEIELSKKNAIYELAKLLKDKEVFISCINGGTFENDIASSCSAIIHTDFDIESLSSENIIIEKVNNKPSFTLEDSKNIINEILELKSGYLSNSSSANLGKICTSNDTVNISYLIRSIDLDELNTINQDTKRLNNNFEVKEVYFDSIWRKRDSSVLLDKYKKIYYDLYGEYPIEDICHGGTECSVLNKNICDAEVISIGANMNHIHTIKEETFISSWKKEYQLLVKLLEIL